MSVMIATIWKFFQSPFPWISMRTETSSHVFRE